jgi:large subunit ribosomal protein L20
MTRVKKGVNASKRRRNRLALTKGYRFGRKSKEKMANEAIRHAGKNAFNDRRKKKRVRRQLWTININAALREHGLTYSKFIGVLSKKGILVDRKILAELAITKPKSFSRLIEKIK